MKRELSLLINGITSLIVGFALLIAGESQDIPLRWIAVAAIWAVGCFKLFYILFERRNQNG